MSVVVFVLVCLLAALMFVELCALVELFRQVQQIRAHLDLVDRPTPIDLGRARGLAPTTFGLPDPLDTAQTAMVLFLSNKCATCRVLASALHGAVPLTMWIVVEPIIEEGEAHALVEEFRLHSERTLIDRQGRIAGHLGLDITPSALFIENGQLHRASTVPSSRQMFSMLPEIRPLNPVTTR